MLTALEQCVRRGLWYLAPPDNPADQPGPTDQDIQLPAVVTDDDLDMVLRDYLGVKLPHKKCCQLHQTPWDAVHDAFFARSVVAVWKASRGLGGKSFTLSALAMAEALFLRADVNILGGSGVQSKRVLEAVASMWAHPTAPKQCLKGEPGQQVQKLIWGNRIQALMASQASVRGPHPQRLRLDELDEMKLAILDSALGQPMTKGFVTSHVVGASTHQYPNGTMTEMLKRAGENGWAVFEWCYQENLEPHGWLSMGEVERKRGILTAAMWETEIELQEPSTEGRAFDTKKVDAAFLPALLVRGSGDKETSEAVLEDPVPGARYGVGGDWAKKKNHTVIVVIRHDVVPARVVYIRRTQKRPWPEMAAELDNVASVYRGTVVHDNTGLGQVVHDLINVDAEPFDMVGRQRAELLSEYIASVEHAEVAWGRDDTNPALQAAYSEHKYATREDIYKGTKDGSGRAHLPDTISAAAFAWRACGGVEAASGVKQPTDRETRHLQQDIQRHRLSGYIRGGSVVQVSDDDDDPTEDDD